MDDKDTKFQTVGEGFISAGATGENGEMFNPFRISFEWDEIDKMVKDRGLDNVRMHLGLYFSDSYIDEVVKNYEFYRDNK